MSLFSRLVKETRAAEKTGAERNYMGGISYRVNPLDTLKMVTSSGIFGEPQYYRDGEFTPAKIMEAKILTCARPPGMKPTSSLANPTIRLVTPQAFMISPAKMKSGIAISFLID